MQIYSNKKNILLLTLPLLALLVTSACLKATKQAADDPGQGLASFEVAEVKGEVASQVDPAQPIANRKQFKFTACIKDRKTSAPAADTRFILADGDTKQEMITDGQGCLVFGRDLQIEPLVEEDAYLPVNRKVMAAPDTDHSGTRLIKLAINPWNFSGKSPEIVDLGKAKLPAGATLALESEVESRLKGQFAATGKNPNATLKALFVDGDKFSLRSTMIDGENMIARRLELRFLPVISISSQGKHVRMIEIANPALQAEAVLMAETVDKREVKVASASEAAVQSSAQNPNRSAAFDFKIEPSKILENARFTLLIKISPVVKESRLKSFEAQLEIGSLQQLKDSMALPREILDNNVTGKFSYDEKVKSLQEVTPVAPTKAPETPPVTPPPAAPQPDSDEKK